MGTIALWPDPVAPLVDAATGRVVLTGYEDGALSVPGAGCGFHAPALAAGGEPVAAAVDDRAGRVLVASGASAMAAPAPWGAPWAHRLRPLVPVLPQGPALTRFVAGQVISFSCSSR
jgi:hypothetical protein